MISKKRRWRFRDLFRRLIPIPCSYHTEQGIFCTDLYECLLEEIFEPQAKLYLVMLYFFHSGT